jgi:hypothetical protein
LPRTKAANSRCRHTHTHHGLTCTRKSGFPASVDKVIVAELHAARWNPRVHGVRACACVVLYNRRATLYWR